MDSVALWMDEEINEERNARRAIRDHFNIDELSERSFIKNFRLSKDAFSYVLRSIEHELHAPIRSTAVTPTVKLAATLTFLGQGGYQHQIGQDRFAGLAQSTTSKCITEVVNAIEKTLCPRHIKFEMTVQEKRESKNHFYSKFGLPGIIGAVDGTHILTIWIKDEHLFFNRKLKHSINAMAICDHKMYIRAVNGVYGGAAHDSHVWSLSNERQHMKAQYQNGDKSSWIIGR
ncbi:putative nuclease HARBI1 [Rhagoletis pomonella]|uniref:putative nuclease HARBI1 n=1 Tax=Rhagoletis pomonella TaxID=28610 RepID=UPI001780C05E|nr:putative nuclease HARBI1 [Rhagoletis pomonella]